MMSPSAFCRRLACHIGIFALGAGAAVAAEVQVAVAANFAGPFAKISANFMAESGHRVNFSVGSTGKFYAQIKAGAPFHVLLAADEATPRKLAAEGAAVAESRFTYARGRLVLWSAKAGVVDAEGAVLKGARFKHLAICNAKLAPYGLAAEQTLKALQLYERLAPRFVVAESVSQAHQFVASGNAELGFVALSQVAVPGEPAAGSYWLVPESLHAPILQDAILLKNAEGNAAAQALLSYLRSAKVRALIESYGYAR